jgi:ABC-type antimicrobial peptide transport system permease subunit
MDPLTLASAVRREVIGVDSQQATFEFRSMKQVLDRSMATRNFILLLLTIFAGIALLLAAIGIYGVMSYAVEQRTHEIGIRMALGAAQTDVLRMVVRYGMILVGIGVAIGIAGAFGVTRVLAAMLYGVKATDPITFAAVALALAAVALFATWLPARRATRVDPIIALRFQ